MSQIKIATSNIKVTFDKKKNVEKMIGMIEEAAKEGANLLVIAEQAVQGYFYSLVGPCSSEIMKYHLDNAEVIPEGESVQAMIKAAQDNNIYVAFGMTERDKKYYDVLYNTAVLIGRKASLVSTEKYISRWMNFIFIPVEMISLYSKRRSEESVCRSAMTRNSLKQREK